MKEFDIHDLGRNGLQGLTRAVLGKDLSKDNRIRCQMVHSADHLLTPACGRCGDWTAAPLSAEQAMLN